MQKKRGGKNRSEAVLEAARELFFTQGYNGTTIEQIAKKAGYSKRTVYLDFLNKDDVFISVCAVGMEILLARLRTLELECLPIQEFIDQFLQVLSAYSREHPNYLRMFCIEATPRVIANCSEAVRRHVGELERAGFRIVVAQVEKAVSEGIIPPIDPWEAAGIFIGSVTGIVLLSLGGSQTVFSQETLETMGKKAGWLLWRGMCQSPVPQ
ncbi:MAG: TetR/AcrR family transcriptional regulator [Proteobacteria bacterium]|nr:TetR/AcrR family transcriptional regulator [Pseudomonadota bacterium]